MKTHIGYMHAYFPGSKTRLKSIHTFLIVNCYYIHWEVDVMIEVSVILSDTI